MPKITQRLRDEHAELLPQLEVLKQAAGALSFETPQEVAARVDEAYDFLTKHLIPHAIAEDWALYPVVARAMGAADATKTMSRDHVEVGALTEQLGHLRASFAGLCEPTKNELRRVLYGLYALVHVHFAKEEEIYLPLLDATLDEKAAAEMFEAMEAAAAAEKAHRKAA